MCMKKSYISYRMNFGVDKNFFLNKTPKTSCDLFQKLRVVCRCLTTSLSPFGCGPTKKILGILNSCMIYGTTKKPSQSTIFLASVALISFLPSPTKQSLLEMLWHTHRLWSQEIFSTWKTYRHNFATKNLPTKKSLYVKSLRKLWEDFDATEMMKITSHLQSTPI